MGPHGWIISRSSGLTAEEGRNTQAYQSQVTGNKKKGYTVDLFTD